VRNCPNCGAELQPFQIRVGVKPFPCASCGKALRVSRGYVWLHILASWLISLGLLLLLRLDRVVVVLLAFPLSWIICAPLPALSTRLVPPTLRLSDSTEHAPKNDKVLPV
jgi:hypothetical protein